MLQEFLKTREGTEKSFGTRTSAGENYSERQERISSNYMENDKIIIY